MKYIIDRVFFLVEGLLAYMIVFMQRIELKQNTTASRKFVQSSLLRGEMHAGHRENIFPVCSSTVSSLHFRTN